MIITRPKLTSAKFYAFMLVGYAMAVLIRMPDILIKRRFWAEEGTVHFYTAWNKPWYDALFSVHFDNLNLTANVATVLAVYLVPLEYAPLVTIGVALLVQLCPALLLITARVEWVRDRVVLTFALLLLLACNNTGEVWLTSIHTQFHLGLCTALILALPTVDGWLGAFRGGLLVLGALTGLASIPLTPLFFLRAWLDRSRARLIQGGLLAAFGGVQVAMLELHSDPARYIGIGPRLLILVVYMKHLIEPLFGHDQAVIIAGRLTEKVVSGGPIWPEITITLIAILAIALAAGERRTRGTLAFGRWGNARGLFLFWVNGWCTYSPSGSGFWWPVRIRAWRAFWAHSAGDLEEKRGMDHDYIDIINNLGHRYRYARLFLGGSGSRHGLDLDE